MIFRRLAVTGLLLFAAALAVSSCTTSVPRTTEPTGTTPASPTPTDPSGDGGDGTATATPTASTGSRTATPTPTTVPGATPTPAATASPGGQLQFEILSPQQGQVISGNAVRVKIAAPPDSSVAVNGVLATARLDGTFTADVVLESGANLIDISASSPSGANSYEDIVLFVVDSDDQPPLDITGPADGASVRNPYVALVGVTDVGASVAVNGRTVPVNQFGIFETEVTLELGPNLVEVVSADTAGGSTTRSLTVFVE